MMKIPYKLYLIGRHLFKRSVGERVLKKEYRNMFGKELNLADPRTFSEKLFHRMIMINRHGNATMTRLSDKYLVRDFVRSMIGEKYLVELLWQGTDPEKIPFDEITRECIIKTNHGSGSNIVVRDAFDREESIRTLSDWLNTNYYWMSREYQYYGIKPRILVEELLNDGQHNGPLDYRFWCFAGKVEFIGVDDHLHAINPFYDVNWKKLPLHSRNHGAEFDVEKPENLDEMISVASNLSSDFDFVRVDLYNVHGRIYFGELTFTPGAGRFQFKPEEWDVVIGNKWIIY